MNPSILLCLVYVGLMFGYLETLVVAKSLIMSVEVRAMVCSFTLSMHGSGTK